MSAKTANTVSAQESLLVVRMAEHQLGLELEKLKALITKSSLKHGGELDILIDVSKVKVSDEDAATVARAFFKNLPFRHMAVFGGSTAVNVGIKLILNLFISPGVGEVKIFKSEEKARSWLMDASK